MFSYCSALIILHLQSSAIILHCQSPGRITENCNYHNYILPLRQFDTNLPEMEYTGSLKCFSEDKIATYSAKLVI